LVKFECQAPLHERKAPLLTTFWRRFWLTPNLAQTRSRMVMQEVLAVVNMLKW